MSDGKKAYVGDRAGDGDIRATNDVDGTILYGNAGDDVLRGGRYDDILWGGSGDDQMFGGDGADQFRFFGDQVTDPVDTDDIYDLDFGEGDYLAFGQYGTGTFSDADGVQSFDGGDDARVTSWAGVVNIVNGSTDITATQYGATNSLVLTLTTPDGDTQNIIITDGWSQYVAAGGVAGA